MIARAFKRGYADWSEGDRATGDYFAECELRAASASLGIVSVGLVVCPVWCYVQLCDNA
ncbi:hypothetical protein AB5J62_37355 [Amycolatopsis sp. cg5]|uniref:hypothetical protein n=1 Tax=Amycolatopsis sp. cg5 TaxID=3238802 RepID=UPI00352494AF